MRAQQDQNIRMHFTYNKIRPIRGVGAAFAGNGILHIIIILFECDRKPL